MGRVAFEEALLSGVNLHAGARFTDGTSPYNFWCAPAASGDGGGLDGLGNGSHERPFATARRAIRQARDGRGDRIILTAGSYAETIDIGSGDSTYGSTGGYAKRNLQIIGDDSHNPSLVQIVGDGTTATATIRVQSGYLRGFVLKNVELDVTTVTQPALHLVTSDTGATPSATSNYYRFLIENVAVSSAQPNVGILFEGAQMGIIRKIWMRGPTIGIGFAGSSSNNPAELRFEDLDFQDCVTADIATVLPSSPTTIAARNMTNISFLRARHWDRGGTPVTNYVNFPDATMVNVAGHDCRWSRDVADGTLMVLPVDVVFTGHSAAGVESIIGA